MTTTQRAVLIRAYGGASAAGIGEIPKPSAGDGQVLVRVRAAGVNGIDWKVREGLVQKAFPIPLPAVLGIELAGTVEAVGPGASRFRVGDRVMGPLGRLGAYTEFVPVAEANLVHTPWGWTMCRPPASPWRPLQPGRACTRRGPSRQASAS